MQKSYFIDFKRDDLMNFKVLVAAPHNEIKNYCLDEYLKSVRSFTYPNYKFLLVDNSKTSHNTYKLRKMGINAIYEPPKRRVNQEYIASSLEVIRQQALQRKFDFLLINETDVICPPDVIERLLLNQKDVVSASYFIKQGAESHLMVQHIEETGNILRSTTNIEKGKDILIADGTTKQVYACGIGCILIHRTVLEKINFRWQKGANAHPDSFFAHDLFQLGLNQYLDTGILCTHLNKSWLNVKDAVL